MKFVFYFSERGFLLLGVDGGCKTSTFSGILLVLFFFQKTSDVQRGAVRQLLMNSVVPEMVLESRMDVACSSISAGETNASIDWYFTVVTLGEGKGVGGWGGG